MLKLANRFTESVFQHDSSSLLLYFFIPVSTQGNLPKPFKNSAKDMGVDKGTHLNNTNLLIRNIEMRPLIDPPLSAPKSFDLAHFRKR